MKELIIVCLIALIITPLVKILNPFGLKKEVEVKLEKPYQVMAEAGSLACMSSKALQEINESLLQKNVKKFDDLMARGVCISLAKGTKLMGPEDACAEAADDVFIPEKKSLRFYIPCFAVK
jgi:hypothetical protein